MQKTQKQEQNVEDNVDESKKPRIIVRNIPFKATKEDVKKFYEPFGEILEINFPKHANGTPVGCCFIHFKQLEDASKAIFNTNKKEFLGRVISSSWAVAKSKYCEKLKKESADTEHLNGIEEHDTEKSKDKETKHREVKEDKDPSKQEVLLQIKRENRKLAKENNRKKRARIVVRNLAFQATEEALREKFSEYGTIEEIKVLKRSDGKNVGCAFLQFELVQNAAKAIHYANLQPFLDRPMIVDWALPKNKFNQDDSKNINKDDIKVEKESDTEDSSTAKSARKSNSREDLGGKDDKHFDIVTENVDSDNDSDDVNIESENKNEDSEAEASENSREDEDEEEKVDGKEIKRPRFESHDVSERKTVFLKNVPFSVKNEELKKCVEQFGPVFYALVCIDPLTEFSKGTAFVKFKNVEDAEKCLSAGSELQIDDQILEAHRALDKTELDSLGNEKQHKERDSRNLYLVKEGVVLAGSPAAAGVSPADMAKRLEIEQWKSQILRNLNMFVSRVRLVVHNLPPTMDDIKLRKIFERHSPSTAIIREVRVMRDLRNIDNKGVGKSKEYAFVSFTKHEDALQALRTINNNPNIFTPNRRPIVSFSIENRVMVNAKQKRLQKSRENNPLWAGNKFKRKENTNAKVPTKLETESKGKRKREDANHEVPVKRLKNEKVDESNVEPYVGMIGKPGQNKLRSKYKLKTQAMLHDQSVRKEKKIKKASKKLEIKRKQKIANQREVKPKQRTKVNPDDANLDKLVNRYRDTLKSMELKKSKWYES
ncbi:RNA-binding protein 28 [Anthophora quadrimaculata]